MLELKREEVVRDQRKLHNEKLHCLYSSPNIIGVIKSRRMRWIAHAAWMGEMRNTYKVLVGKPEGKRPHGRCLHRWDDDDDNNVMDLKETGWKDVE